VRFSIRLNNDLPVAAYAELAQAAEAAGFDQIWVSHDLFLRSVWVILTTMARATTRIQVGTCVVNPYTTHPAEIAMGAATLDELSGGRFLLGVSSGANAFMRWVGIEQPRPVAAVAETVRAVRGLLAGESPDTLSGSFVRNWTREAYLRMPVRPVPIYVGAMGPRMLRLIGEVADGGLPLLFPPEIYERAIGQVRTGAAAAGRDVSSIDVAACVWCSVANTRAAAEAPLRDKVAYYGPALGPTILGDLGLTAMDFEPIRVALHVERDAAKARALVTAPMLRIGIAGSPDEVVERLRGLQRSDASHLSFGPPLGADPLHDIAVLGREVLPRLR
jgi:5,10-methylenetetrahydromethanopterin reductase